MILTRTSHRSFTKTSRAVLIAMLVAISVSAQGPAIADTYFNRDNRSEYMVLNADGTLNWHGQDGEDHTGKYKVDGDVLTVRVGFIPFKAKLVNGTIVNLMHKTWAKDPQPVSAPPATSSTEAGAAQKIADINKKIVGKWSSSDGKNYIEFFANGSCSEGALFPDGKWHIEQGKLDVWEQGEDFRCLNGVLRLVGPDTLTRDYGMRGEPIRYYRDSQDRPKSWKNSASPEELAGSVMKMIYAKCGDSYYRRDAVPGMGSIGLFEYKGVSWNIAGRELTPADRLNGMESKTVITVRAQAYRSNGGGYGDHWSQWGNGIGPDTGAFGGVRNWTDNAQRYEFVRKNGRWEWSGPPLPEDYAISCSDAARVR